MTLTAAAVSIRKTDTDKREDDVSDDEFDHKAGKECWTWQSKPQEAREMMSRRRIESGSSQAK